MVVRIKCGSCEEVVKKNEHVACCSACKKSFHGNCTNLTEAEFQIACGKSKLKWFCDMCDSDVTDMLNNFDKFRKVSVYIEKQRAEIDRKMDIMEKRIAGIEVSSSNKAVGDKIEQQVQKSADDDRKETELIRSKEQNLVFFNVPESDEDNVGERMKFDFNLLSEAYKQELKHDQISSLFRVGKKGEKVRPLIVKFKSVEIKNNMLKKTSKMNIKHDNEVRPIYVAIDRTEKQREEHRKLVSELRERKSRGENDLIIRNNKIVKNFQDASGANRVTWNSLFMH